MKMAVESIMTYQIEDEVCPANRHVRRDRLSPDRNEHFPHGELGSGESIAHTSCFERQEPPIVSLNEKRASPQKWRRL